jgi:F420-dependent oxidoreductase-like protein
MASHPIRFGIQTGQQNIAWDDMLAIWQKADGWGYDSLWNFDHFFAIFVDPTNPCFEGWTTLSALAQATKRARIGSLVNGNTYRNPCLTAKMAATLDHVSHGRLNFGIGAGWFQQEHDAFGMDFKTVPGRLAALDEALEIIKGMFTQPKTTVHGRHYRVTDAIGEPKPVQKPYPPIMIGGTGEKVLLRIVAKHADMWNAAGSAEFMAQKIDIIRRHGEKVDRDTDRIEKTVMMPLCYRRPPGKRVCSG